MSAPQSTKRFLPKRQVGARYGVTTRTVDRWKYQKVIPPPDLTINYRHYWSEDGLDRHDRQCVAEPAATVK
jgi:DNA-binding transcriptional MerR regulator